MYFSIFVVIIPIYADNQDYGEIVTVGYHLSPPLINLNPPEIYPEPKITDIEGENFKLYSHEFFTIKIPESFVPDDLGISCQLHDQLCHYGKWFWSPLPEGATEYDIGKKRQYMFISFKPYSSYQNIVDLTNDATFDVPYVLDEMQRKGYLKDLFSLIKNKIDYNCYYNDNFGCKNLVINDVRFMNINDMPAFQIESEFDWKPSSPYSTEHYKYDETTDEKLRTFEHVSEIRTMVFTKGFIVDIFASTTHSDYVENPASWKDIIHGVNSFDTINDVHKITDPMVLERLEETRNKFDTILENNMYRIEKLNQTKIQITNLVDKLDSRPICGKGTIEKNGQCIPDTKTKPSLGGGCLITTATYGSELAPQVQQLRELRDNSLLSTQSGTNFMNSFNDFYYSFSPIIADFERENSVFKEMVKIAITPMITSLSILNYVDMDSEAEVLGYGISLILLNVGMYFVAPVIVLVGIRKRF